MTIYIEPNYADRHSQGSFVPISAGPPRTDGILGLVNRSPVTWPVADAAARCPCQSGESYGACCAPVHLGTIAAPTAERLMRSRYSAFVVGDARYLLESWHSSTRPPAIELDPGLRWLGLEIMATENGRMLDTIGTVEFRARYSQRGAVGEQHERSRFVRESRRWFYLGAD
ncbi:MAG: hypothetical protein JWN09_2424 [Microbacteriaceae bacterium]|jgi:SEC-C motif-containing protein|nr:hypothetical protein [Microbacteriaceae bacterium]